MACNELCRRLQETQGQAKSEWVFPYERDPKKHIESVKGSYRRAVKLAGIKPITFHQLRHTFCTRLAAAGVDISTISELAGHCNVSMTERYVHPSNKLKQRGVELLVGGGNGGEPATKSATSVVLPGEGEGGAGGQETEGEEVVTVH